MALQVWLPLNGNIENLGVQPITNIKDNGAYNTGGPLGQYASFNGTNSKAWQLSENITYPVSLSAWINMATYTASYSSTRFFVNVTNGTDGTPGGIVINMGCYNNAFRANCQGTSFNFPVNPTPNTWVHVVITIDENKLAKGYLNGSFVGNIGNCAGTVTGTHIAVGGAANTEDRSVAGSVCDVRLYDQCLSAKEIKEISKCLCGHWLLDGPLHGNPNLLMDGRFDKGLTYWPYSSNNVVIEPNGGIGGRDCLKITITDSGTVTPRQIPNVTLKANKTYTVSAICKTLTGDLSGYNIRVANQIDIVRQQIIDLNNGWKRYIYKYTGSSDVTLTNAFGFQQGANGTSFLLSEIKLEEGAEATPYAPNLIEAGLTNTNIEYDTSGYNCNMILNPNSTYTNINQIYINGNSPRYTGSYLFDIPGRVGFNGTKQIYNKTGTDAITVACWHKKIIGTSANGYENLISNRSSSSKYNWMLCTYQKGTNADKIYFHGNAQYISDFVWPRDSLWHHVCAVVSNNQSKIYFDGQLIYGPAEYSFGGASDGLFLGTCYYYNEFLSGYLSDVRIYGSALSETDVKELYETSMIVDSNGNILPRVLTS